jgi:hypothetical protein
VTAAFVDAAAGALMVDRAARVLRRPVIFTWGASRGWADDDQEKTDFWLLWSLDRESLEITALAAAATVFSRSCTPVRSCQANADSEVFDDEDEDEDEDCVGADTAVDATLLDRRRVLMLGRDCAAAGATSTWGCEQQYKKSNLNSAQ